MRPIELLGYAAMLAAAAFIASRKPKVVVVVMQQRFGEPPAEPEPEPEEQLQLPGPKPPPVSNPRDCPVCGWSPCLDDCPIGFNQYDLEKHDAEEELYREPPPGTIPEADEED